MSKKLLALLLAALLTAPAFLSCSDSGTNEESPAETTASTPSAEEETVAEETEPSIYDDVPTGSYDGHNFNMLNVVSNYAYVLLTAEELIGAFARKTNLNVLSCSLTYKIQSDC